MIILLEIHQVIGERELDFEDTYHDRFLGSPIDTATRLMWFAWSPHGGGEGYEAVTVMGFDGLEAWDAFVERTRYGDLSGWATEVDSMRYFVHASLHQVPEWSPTSVRELSSVTVAPEEHPPSLLRLDSVRFGAGSEKEAQRVCEAASTTTDTLLELVGCWSNLLGSVDGAVTHFLLKVRNSEMLSEQLANQDPLSRWSGSPSTLGSVQRSSVRSRLLRTVRWSPLF
jgi:hypothetical protein